MRDYNDYKKDTGREDESDNDNCHEIYCYGYCEIEDGLSEDNEQSDFEYEYIDNEFIYYPGVMNDTYFSTQQPAIRLRVALTLLRISARLCLLFENQ